MIEKNAGGLGPCIWLSREQSVADGKVGRSVYLKTIPIVPENAGRGDR